MAIEEQSFEQYISTLSRSELEQLLLETTADLTTSEEQSEAYYAILEANGLMVHFVDNDMPTQENGIFGSALAYGGRKLKESHAKRKYARAAGQKAIAEAELAKLKGKW
jgi:hypothetical protein